MQLQDTCDMYTCVRISSTCLLRSQSRYFEINSVSNRRRILLFILLYCSYLLNPHCYQVPSSAPYTVILPVLQVKHHSILY